MNKATTPAIDLPEDITTAVDARLFGAVAVFRAKQDIRWYLNGVHLMPHPGGSGVLIVATNGHQLGVAFDANGRTPGPQTLTCSAKLAAAARDCRKKPDSHVVIQDGRIRVLSALLEEMYVQPGPTTIEAAEYPKVLRVLQPALGELRPGCQGPFNPKYLGVLDKLGEDLSSRFAAPLFHWTTPDGMLITRFAAESELLAVTMSLREQDLSMASAPVPVLLRGAIERDRAAAEAAAKQANDEKAADLAGTAISRVNADAEPAAA